MPPRTIATIQRWLRFPRRAERTRLTLRQSRLAVSNSHFLSPSKQQGPYPPEHKPQHQHSNNNNPTQLQHCDFVPTSRHACQPSRTPPYTCRHIAENLIRAVKCILGSGIVVDVECDVFKLGGLGCEGRKECVILLFCSVGAGHFVRLSWIIA